MNLTDKQAKEIYQQYNNEKIICGIKNHTLEIKFIKHYIWFLPLFILLGFSSNLRVLQILTDSESIIIYIIALFFFVLSIFVVLSQSYKLYFDNNNLILRNKLNKRIVIDINRYPRIYIRHQIYNSYNHVSEHYRKTHRYDLHIEQDNNDIVLDISTIGSKKIKLLLDNFETKERQDITDSQWQESSNEKEKTFSNYISFLSKQEKIIGVKNSNNMKIINNSNLMSKFIICTLIIIISFYLSTITSTDLSNFFLTISAFGFLFDLFVLISLVEKGTDSYLKISYPSEGTIKINKYLLNYKKNNIMISIRPIQKPTSFEKYNYMLIINGKNHSYSIDLTLQQEKQLGDFIDNLIFEPKKL